MFDVKGLALRLIPDLSRSELIEVREAIQIQLNKASVHPLDAHNIDINSLKGPVEKKRVLNLVPITHVTCGGYSIPIFTHMSGVHTSCNLIELCSAGHPGKYALTGPVRLESIIVQIGINHFKLTVLEEASSEFTRNATQVYKMEMAPVARIDFNELDMFGNVVELRQLLQGIELKIPVTGFLVRGTDVEPNLEMYISEPNITMLPGHENQSYLLPAIEKLVKVVGFTLDGKLEQV